MDEHIGHIQDWSPWCTLFADDIVLIDEIREGVNPKFESWQKILKVKGFRFNRLTKKYMEFKFSSSIYKKKLR